MRVRILANQIPPFWDSIKYCMVNVNAIDDGHSQLYFNELLHDLLSDTAQCFVRLSTDRILESLMVTKIIINKLTNIKTLHIHGLYSFRRASMKEWAEDFKLIRNFANRIQCKTITFDTDNAKVMELGRSVGFVDGKKSFVLDLGGS